MKHIVVSGKQRIVGVDNVGDDDEDYNQYEEMTLFTNLEKIKHIEETNDYKNLVPYMRRDGKGKNV